MSNRENLNSELDQGFDRMGFPYIIQGRDQKSTSSDYKMKMFYVIMYDNNFICDLKIFTIHSVESINASTYNHLDRPQKQHSIKLIYPNPKDISKATTFIIGILGK